MLLRTMKPGWQGRVCLFTPLGVYLFVYPTGIALLSFGLMPPGASWVGGVLLLAQAAAMVAWLAINFGPSKALAAGCLVAALSWALEAGGVTQGWPFGDYSYTAALGPWFGPVPLAIPFAWIASVFAALFTARMLLQLAGTYHTWLPILFAALLATGQDFVLEPIATFVQGYWQWHAAAGIYGVPWQNFASWFVATLVLSALAQLLLGPLNAPQSYLWAPPLILLLSLLMFGWLDLLHGYGLAALVAVPLGTLALVALLKNRSLVARPDATIAGRALVVLLLLVGAGLLYGCGVDASMLQPEPTVTIAATIALPTNTPALPTSTSTVQPSPTATVTATEPPPTATPISPTPTATPVLLAPNPSTTSALLLNALDAMQNLSSYEYTATVKSYNQGNPISSTSAGTFVAPDRLLWANSTQAITSDAVISGSIYYVSYDNENWILAGSPDKERIAQAPWTLAAYGHVLSTTTEIDTDGSDLTHVTFSVPVDKLTLANRQWKKATCDIWIKTDNNRIVALRLVAVEPTYDTTQRFYFFNFNAPVNSDQWPVVGASTLKVKR